MQIQVTKRLFYSVLLVLVWLGFVVEGSHALFSDQVILAGNSITTGTAALLISNSQANSSTIYDHSRPGFAFTLNPGDTEQKYFLLKNASDSPISFDLTVGAVVATTSSDLPTAVNLEILPVDDTGVPISGWGATAPLGAYSNQSMQKLTGIVLGQGDTQRFMMRVNLNSTYTTQAQSINFDLNFIGTQHLN